MAAGDKLKEYLKQQTQSPAVYNVAPPANIFIDFITEINESIVASTGVSLGTLNAALLLYLKKDGTGIGAVAQAQDFGANFGIKTDKISSSGTNRVLMSNNSTFGFAQVTTVQRDALVVAGLENFFIYNTDTHQAEYYNGTSWLPAGGGLVPANNLSDVADAGTSRTNLGLGNIDNTADADKPVSTAQQAALDSKANDGDVVHDTGDENIAGIKTFDNSVLVTQSFGLTGIVNVTNDYGVYPTDCTIYCDGSSHSIDVSNGNSPYNGQVVLIICRNKDNQVRVTNINGGYYIFATANDALLVRYDGNVGEFTIIAEYKQSVGVVTSSGTYTPTCTVVTNVDTVSSVGDAQYMRVGNVVTVSGAVAVDPTSNGSTVEFTMSVPISSAFTLAEQAGGTGYHKLKNMVAEIASSATNDKVTFLMIAQDAGSMTLRYSFTYLIV